MSTAEALDKGVSGGLKLLSQRMREMSAEIKVLDARRIEAIKARDEAKHKYRNNIGQLKYLEQQILEKEEQHKKAQERYKQAFDRLNEKQGYIVRARMFNKALETVEPEKIVVLEEKVRDARLKFMESRKKYQAAKDRQIELEQRVEFKENKVKEIERRVSEYSVSLEYRKKEHDIKKQRFNQAISGSEGAEEKLRMNEELVHNATERLSAATRAITALEARIAAAEDALEKYKSQRLSMESTLRELLSSAVNMNKKKDGQAKTAITRVNATH